MFSFADGVSFEKSRILRRLQQEAEYKRQLEKEYVERAESGRRARQGNRVHNQCENEEFMITPLDVYRPPPRDVAVDNDLEEWDEYDGDYEDDRDEIETLRNWTGDTLPHKYKSGAGGRAKSVKLKQGLDSGQSASAITSSPFVARHGASSSASSNRIDILRKKPDSFERALVSHKFAAVKTSRARRPSFDRNETEMVNQFHSKSKAIKDSIFAHDSTFKTDAASPFFFHERQPPSIHRDAGSKRMLTTEHKIFNQSLADVSSQHKDSFRPLPNHQNPLTTELLEIISFSCEHPRTRRRELRNRSSTLQPKMDPVIVEDASDSQHSDYRKLTSVWRNRRPSPEEWMEPIL